MCNAEAPSVEEVVHEHSEGVTVMGIAWNGSLEEMAGFVGKHHLSFPNAADLDGSLFARFNVPEQPAWVFVDASGKSTRVLGRLRDDALIAKLKDLAGG